MALDWIVNMLVGQPTLVAPDFNYPDVARDKYEEWRERNLLNFVDPVNKQVLLPDVADYSSRFGNVDYFRKGVVEEPSEDDYFPPDPIEPIVIPPIPPGPDPVPVPTPTPVPVPNPGQGTTITYDYSVTGDTFNIAGDYIQSQTINEMATVGEAQRANASGDNSFMMMMMMMMVFGGLGGMQPGIQQQQPVYSQPRPAPYYSPPSYY